MTLLPVIEMVARQFRWSGIPGSAVVVQQLTIVDRHAGRYACVALRSSIGAFVQRDASGFLARPRQDPFRRGHMAWPFPRALRLGKLGVRQDGTRIRQRVASWRAEVDCTRHYAGRLRRDCVARGVACQSKLERPPARGFPAWSSRPCSASSFLSVPTGVMPLSSADVAGLRPLFWGFLSSPYSADPSPCCSFWNSGTPAASVPVEICTGWWHRRCCLPSLCSRW